MSMVMAYLDEVVPNLMNFSALNHSFSPFDV